MGEASFQTWNASMSGPIFHLLPIDDPFIMEVLMEHKDNPDSIVARKEGLLGGREGPPVTKVKAVLDKIDSREVLKKMRKEVVVEEAERAREEGNNYFRSGDYESAADAYRKAVFLVGRSTYQANLAAAYLKLGDFEEAEEAASECLYSSPRFLKARYRTCTQRVRDDQIRYCRFPLYASPKP